MLIGGVMPDVVQAHLRMTRVGGPLEDAGSEHRGKHLGEEGRDFEEQGLIVLVEERVEVYLRLGSVVFLRRRGGLGGTTLSYQRTVRRVTCSSPGHLNIRSAFN